MSKKRSYEAMGNGSQYASMDCERFIAAIKAHPGIWQINHPDHKVKQRTRRLWDEIQGTFPEFRVDDLKKRWKNLKDTYRKEVKRLPQHRPGVPDDNFTSGWRYYESLHFLRHQFSFNRRDDCGLPEPEKYQEASSQSPASPASSKSDDEEPETPTTSKRKELLDVRAELLKIERKKMKILEEEIAKSNEHTQSDNYHFLMSLLPEMEKLGPVQKMRLRSKINQAVLEELTMGSYDHGQGYSEIPIQIREQIQFETTTLSETPVTEVTVVKEEAINMYD